MNAYEGAHPPLYYIILHFWMKLFAWSESSIRLLSVLFGIGTVYAMYKVAKQIIDKETAIFASAITGLSAFQLYFSQEARMYSLLTLLALLSFYFLNKIVQKSDLRGSFYYLASTIFCMYTDYSAFLVLAVQNIYVLFTNLKSRNQPLSLSRWFSLQALLLIAFLPQAGNFIFRLIMIQKDIYAMMPRPGIGALLAAFLSYSGSAALLSVMSFFAVYALISHKKGAVSRATNNSSHEGYFQGEMLLFIWLIVPVAVLFSISQFSAPIFYPKLAIVSSLAFYLLAAKGIRDIQGKLFKNTAIVCTAALFLVQAHSYYRFSHKEQWREVAEYLDKNALDSDLLVFNPGYCQEGIFDYYSKRPKLEKIGFPADGSVFVSEKQIEEFLSLTKGRDRVWFIFYRRAYGNDPKAMVTKALDGPYRPEAREYLGIDVYLFKKGIENGHFEQN
jgi:uncharacterized membrane protein